MKSLQEIFNEKEKLEELEKDIADVLYKYNNAEQKDKRKHLIKLNNATSKYYNITDKIYVPK